VSKRFGRNQRRQLKALAEDNYQAAIEINRTLNNTAARLNLAERQISEYNNVMKTLDYNHYGVIRENQVATWGPVTGNTVRQTEFMMSFDVQRICYGIDPKKHTVDQVVTEIHSGLSQMIIDHLYTRLRPVFEKFGR